MKHLQEDHDRLMERHSSLLQEMAAKELAARNRHEELVKLANQAEKAKQDAVANAQTTQEVLKQTFKVGFMSFAGVSCVCMCKSTEGLNPLSSPKWKTWQALMPTKWPSCRSKLMTWKTGSFVCSWPRLRGTSDDTSLIMRWMITMYMSFSAELSQDINVNLLEREAAEGSENAELIAQSNRSSLSPLSIQQATVAPTHQRMNSTTSSGPKTPMPLDQLLFSPQGDNSAGKF